MDGAADHTPFEARLTAALSCGILIGLLFVVGCYLFHAYYVATFPYDIDYGEGIHLNWVQRIANGNWCYEDIHEEPYLVDVYPPLYPFVVSFPVRWWGLSFAWGRWLSLLAALGTALAVFAIVRRLSGQLFPAVVAGLFFFLPMHVYFWTPLHRVDSLALFLTTLGLYLAVSGRGVAWCAILFALALVTRQTTLFAAMSVVAWLAYQRHWRRVFLFSLVAFGVPAVVYLMMHLITDGQFLRHTMTYHAVQAFRWDTLYVFGAEFLQHLPILVGAGLFVLWRRLRSGKFDLPSSYLLAAMAHFCLSGKVGSAWNYMLELVVALCIMVGVTLFEVDRIATAKGSRLRIVLRVLLLAQLLLAFQIPRYREVLDAPTPDASYVQRARQLSQLIQRTEGDCLAEHMGYLVLNGKPVTFQPFLMKQLAEKGKWNPQPMIDDLARKRYKLIILNFDVEIARETAKFQEAMIKTIAKYYQPIGFVPGPGGDDRKPSRNWNYWLYRPKR